MKVSRRARDLPRELERAVRRHLLRHDDDGLARPGNVFEDAGASAVAPDPFLC
jgi:hypothetical protein